MIVTTHNTIAALVDELFMLGVRDVVISPGSRSTPLAVLFCERGFQTFVNIDERSAGFFALGVATERQRPVVLVCTSGSAPAHYLPAVMEARHAGVPLIILTADRPHELRQVGAPQTVDQNRLYGAFAKYYEELPIPEATASMCRHVRVVAQKAFAHCMSKGYGVSHINVPLRAPLVPDLTKVDFTCGQPGQTFEYVKGTSTFTFDETVFQKKNGIIICGGDPWLTCQKDILALGQRLSAPILADPLSNMRNYPDCAVMDCYDAFLKNETAQKELRPEYVIHFGQLPISRSLQRFLSAHENARYIQVSECSDYRNPLLSTDCLVEASPEAFANAIHIQSSDTGYLEKWIGYRKKMREKMRGATKEPSMFEGGIVQILQDRLPPESRWAVANSMPIYSTDCFLEARAQSIKVLGKRGTNGIDGTVSTALGISVSGAPTVLLTGDLALFHDLSGLLIGKTHHLHLTIVLLNNNGGGIFHHLPQRSLKRFEYLFQTPHQMDFRGLSALYGIAYDRAENYENFIQLFDRALSSGGIRLIEVPLDPEKSKVLYDKYTTL
ncbi:MAG: 2-succinyl-5-enolpyruvyl-6-hydroxy-3-cyclohexene-1-carboxylic-acid synthase [Burkholderiales bacterium]|jgi:2-succinyl-5-enolpyruvyl-6-hydroxy-3-cyclohexene-1-carboxylate synthase|nr:2-succinyl-5-enolpyruvyl-6-hydroxy-3-cyclohexene-1-carboxylic-acid synthase [Burkholderiales bacterium]